MCSFLSILGNIVSCCAVTSLYITRVSRLKTEEWVKAGLNSLAYSSYWNILLRAPVPPISKRAFPGSISIGLCCSFSTSMPSAPWWQVWQFIFNHVYILEKGFHNVSAYMFLLHCWINHTQLNTTQRCNQSFPVILVTCSVYFCTQLLKLAITSVSDVKNFLPSGWISNVWWIVYSSLCKVWAEQRWWQNKMPNISTAECLWEFNMHSVFDIWLSPRYL